MQGLLPDICSAFLIVCGSLFIIRGAFYRFIYGASLSLDLKRGPLFPGLNCGVYRHFDRATYIKFVFRLIQKGFHPNMEAILNLLGILKEGFEVERVELEVMACLSGGNLASLELGVATIAGYF